MATKYKFTFTKFDKVKYISHLDLMRLFMRASRRANLPLFLTKGFSPHPKIIFKRALKLGIESDNEEATILLDSAIKPSVFKKKLQSQLPIGIMIKNVTVTNYE